MQKDIEEYADKVEKIKHQVMSEMARQKRGLPFVKSHPVPAMSSSLSRALTGVSTSCS